MKEVVYHGSPNPNIKVLVPNSSTHLKRCIYATSNKVVAMLHMGKGNGDLDTKVYTLDGKLHLVERREGVLESLYSKEGYLYVLDGRTFNHYDYLWSMEVISFEESIMPLSKICYPNILDVLIEEENNGNIKIYRYPNRPNDIPMDNSDLIDKFIRFEENGSIGSISRLLEIYPEFSHEVKERIIKQKIKKNNDC